MGFKISVNREIEVPCKFHCNNWKVTSMRQSAGKPSKKKTVLTAEKHLNQVAQAEIPDNLRVELLGYCITTFGKNS